MARQMGIGGMAAGVGPQAANIWKMLDDLAVTDVKAYEELAKAGRDALVSMGCINGCIHRTDSC